MCVYCNSLGRETGIKVFSKKINVLNIARVEWQNLGFWGWRMVLRLVSGWLEGWQFQNEVEKEELAFVYRKGSIIICDMNAIRPFLASTLHTPCKFQLLRKVVSILLASDNSSLFWKSGEELTNPWYDYQIAVLPWG